MSEFFSPISGRRVAATQQEAFHSLSAKRLGATSQMVMDCFDDPNTLLTREDIAARTNLRLSSVCGRVRGLLDANLLVKRDTVICKATGKQQERLGLPKA